VSKVNVLDILYNEERSPLEFHFDALMGPNVSNFFIESEIYELYNIAKSNKLAGNVKEKKRLINEIVYSKGFRRWFSGTNRVIYRYLEDNSFCLKIAFDSVGLSDSLREYENQFYLKPFCTKIFDVHSCGVVSTTEVVQPIRLFEEFAQVAEDVFDLIVNRIIGKYVLDDIGCIEFFQNYGVRKGFGPVLLDFPYMYKLDGNKLYCTLKDKASGVNCSGLIDYDKTFDNIICTKCGKRYFAKDLQSSIDNNIIYVKGVNDVMSKVYLYQGENLESIIGGNESDFIDRSSNRITPSTKDQQIYDDFVPNGRRNRIKEQSKSETNIPNIIEQKVRVRSTTEIHKDKLEIPSNLGEIINQNILDEEDDEENILNKFNLKDSDFEENSQINTEYNQEDDVEYVEKIRKMKQKVDQDNDHLY